HEGEPVAAWLRGLGLDAHVFRYPVRTRHPEVVEAVLAEVRRVREAGADRVALLGFSAGGHAAGHAALTAAAAAHADGVEHAHGADTPRSADPAARVDAAILCYPVVSMLLDTHAGSRRELLGPDADEAARAATSLEKLVTASAPPFFIWHTAEDESVPVEHAYLLGSALAAQHVPHALHVFPHGPHGIGLAAGHGDAEGWTTLCASWLRESGWLD
ncbi:MAG: prolyl oligopeptidase family serine peptidase, partial [Microbacteriaceae bacterium]